MGLDVRQHSLLLDGQPCRLVSGAMHYFRIHPDYWLDRLRKAKQCGLNTIETYCCWNLHEPREGEFHFGCGLDVARFIRLAGELGLHVLVRPGPFICSEWDFGGMPAWLTTKPGLRVRCRNEAFLAAVDRYFAVLLPHLTPLQHDRGGPILAMQIENEYGGFGNDTDYLRDIRDCLLRHGAEVPLFTSDGASERMLRDGAVPGHLQTVNFRKNPERVFALARRVHPDYPDFAMEYWSGKGHLWGDPFWVHPVPEVAAETEWMLRHGASLNFYMFHGGTSFGFMNGARFENGKYRPHITSYDTDAPLNEAGDPTPKYFAIQQAIANVLPETPVEAPSTTPKQAYGAVPLTASLSLFDALPQLAQPTQGDKPLRFEDLETYYGFLLYRTQITQGGRLVIEGLRDRAQVFLDGKPVGTLYRNDPETVIDLQPGRLPAQLDILVENLGRVNCGGANLYDSFKGLTGAVTLAGDELRGWEHFPLPLDTVADLEFPAEPATAEGPVFLRGNLRIEGEPQDTFLKVPAGTKGVCWINGFNLGRYWSIGPQRSLYVPAPLLRQGNNDLIVFELHGLERREAFFADAPEFTDRRNMID
jgi:beta-galactosidase